jgi:hypothetical protein
MVVREKAKVKGLILPRFAPRPPEQIAARVWQILTSQFQVENSLLVVRENTIRIIRLKPLKNSVTPPETTKTSKKPTHHQRE